MTVHGHRSKSADKMKYLEGHQNGYMSTMVYSQDDEYLNTNRSWNGFVFHVTPARNGHKNGFIPVPTNSQESPRNKTETKPKFSIGDDEEDEKPCYANYNDLENEPIYVSLDNNYILQNSFTPSSRHLSMIDFKRNQLNNSTRSEKSRQYLSAHSQVFVDRNRNIDSSSKPWKRKSLKKLAENIGTVLSLSPRKDGNPKLFSPKQEETFPKRERSKSVGDLEMFNAYNTESESKDSHSDSEDDDVDGDDFGFLSYPFSSASFLSLAMNRSKSPAPTHRILPRIRKSKTKAIPCMWSSQVGELLRTLRGIYVTYGDIRYITNRYKLRAMKFLAMLLDMIFSKA